MSERRSCIGMVGARLRMQGLEGQSMQRLEAAPGEGSEHHIPHQRVTEHECVRLECTTRLIGYRQQPR